jgi:hypothetical protein
MTNKSIKFILLVILTLSIDFIFARAGGGGGSGGAGGGILMTILAFIIAPFLLVYAVIVSIMLERKRNKAKRLLVCLQTKVNFLG